MFGFPFHSAFFTTETEDFHKKQHTYLGVPGDQESHWDLRNRERQSGDYGLAGPTYPSVKGR